MVSYKYKEKLLLVKNRFQKFNKIYSKFDYEKEILSKKLEAD